MPATDPVTMENAALARGADRVLLSPDGRWMVLQYALAGQLPLVVRLDRRETMPTAVGRGLLAGPPGSDGTVFYFEHEAPGMREVLATPADKRRSHLRRLGEPSPLLSIDGAHGGWPAARGQLVIIGGTGDRMNVLIFDTDKKIVLARRELAGAMGFLADFAVANGLVHLLFDASRVADPAIRDSGLVLLTLAVPSLDEVWKREGVAPADLFARPKFGVIAADRRIVVLSDTSEKMATFDAKTGQPGPVLQLAVGRANLDLLPAARPAEDTFVLWTKPGRGANSRRGWKLVRIRGDEVEVVVDRPEELPPGAGTWDGKRVVLAPFGPPRVGEPGEWGDEVRRYLKLLD
ncbi:MAG: hypothetical protein MJE77_21255 [Proteobacteria bacterium]|nr:hypothetical protein [Pseudomonadota bacterium]